MFHLITVVVAIALSAAIAVATLVYLPADLPNVERAAQQAAKGAMLLEGAFLAEARANARQSGEGPTLSSNPLALGSGDPLAPYYSFLPAAPEGFEWRLGAASHPVHGAGTYYVCLAPVVADTASDAVYRGLVRAQRGFSAQQFFVSGACGASSNMSAPSSYPSNVSATYWVRYVVDMS